LYLGDEVLFRHTADIGFSHLYTISSRMVPGQEVDQNRQVLGLWAVFSKLGIPLDLLKIVIMIPLGAVVVVIFRNVFGFRTFGTFLPVLIAASARHTGLLWGLAGFVGILLVVSIVRRITGRLQLLHSPQLAILLTTVIGVMLVTAILADHLGVPALARVTLFPVAIMAITAERFTLMDVEEGLWVAWATLLRTLVVVTVAYLCINSLSLQVMMLAFPELLLAVVVIDLWLGRWMGMRLLEWVRFRSLLSSQPQGAKA
jgi:hypothetical protein